MFYYDNQYSSLPHTVPGPKIEYHAGSCGWKCVDRECNSQYKSLVTGRAPLFERPKNIPGLS